jgi:coenzyme F420 hydrogenase subunit beta
VEEKKKGFSDLFADVINQGLCCVCGTCVGVCPRDTLTMDFGDPPFFDKEPQPKVREQNCNECSLCYTACPGREIPLPELDKSLFGRQRNPENEPLGIYRGIYEGFAMDSATRDRGPSGGATTAIVMYALEKGIIDGAIVATNNPRYPWRMTPTIATTAKELIAAMSSKHILVPTNALLSEAIMRRGLKNLAVVGCPCHIEGIRKIQMEGAPKKIAEAVKLTISLYCGRNYWWEGTRHLLSEECGVTDLREVKSLTYRGGERPKRLIVQLADGGQKEVSLLTSVVSYILPNQSERCSLCYDFSGEVADISVGDHYLAFFLRPDKPGWNSIIARTEIGEEILLNAQQEGYLFVREGPEEFVITNFGCECKKHGSVHQLQWRKKHGWAVPDFGYELGAPGPWAEKYRTANTTINESYWEEQ